MWIYYYSTGAMSAGIFTIIIIVVVIIVITSVKEGHRVEFTVHVTGTPPLTLVSLILI